MKALIVEDESPIREVIKKYLERSGFVVEEAGSGEVALVKFNNGFDIVILDLNLPNQDGLAVCQAIRKKSAVPIIMATARTEEIDELRGLSTGADDYIKKPFSPKVLVARAESLIRRMAEVPHKNGDLQVDLEKMVVIKAGQVIPLTTTQFKLIKILTETPEKVFSRNELLAAISGEDRLKQAMERTIDAHIKSIRKLVETDPQNPKYIKTVIGTGYKYSHETA